MNKFIKTKVFPFLGVLICLTVILIPACENDPEEPGEKPSPPPPQKTFSYSQYGAVGDGETDDFDAIIATHEAANAVGAKVKADAGATYYIGNAQKTAVIKTDTDWTGAEFIIDDSELLFEERTLTGNFKERVWQDSWVFAITPSLDSYRVDSIATLEKNQSKLNESFPQSTLFVALDNTTTRYIRRGENANSGVAQRDVFVVDKNGNVDMDAPIIWDFNNISSLTAYPIDEKTLTVTGGRFTTINNQGNADDRYMRRGINVIRSNTVIDGIDHEITGERIPASNSATDLLQGGASYYGFLYFENCANVTVKNSKLCGHRGYRRPSQTGTTRGSYDIQAITTVNLSVIDTDQYREITNGTYWGIFASNYSKNIKLDNVKFSRFDAHMGVYNTTITNSELGYQGCSIIGSGELLIENTSVSGANFIYFRDDYGSTWEGEVTLRDCTFNPTSWDNARIFHTNNDGAHNFGYPCYMPETITIEGFTVNDAGAPSSYGGVYLVGGAGSVGQYGFELTKTIYISGFVSSKPYRFSNTFLSSRIQVVDSDSL